MYHRTAANVPQDSSQCTTGQQPMYHRTAANVPQDSSQCTTGQQSTYHRTGDQITSCIHHQAPQCSNCSIICHPIALCVCVCVCVSVIDIFDICVCQNLRHHLRLVMPTHQFFYEQRYHSQYFKHSHNNKETNSLGGCHSSLIAAWLTSTRMRVKG